MRFETPTRSQIPCISDDLPGVPVLGDQHERVFVLEDDLLSMNGSSKADLFGRSDGFGFDFVKGEDDGERGPEDPDLFIILVV
jgi:hypothetical protein